MDFTSPDYKSPAIRTCRRCHRLLVNGYGELLSLCSECIEIDKEDYRIVKDYIQSHVNTTIYEVSQVTGVSLKVIMQFLREDRIQVIDTKNKINLK